MDLGILPMLGLYDIFMKNFMFGRWGQIWKVDLLNFLQDLLV